MKSPKLSLQFSWFQPHRSVITDRINTEFRRKNFIFKKQNENLEDETNNAFVKFLRLSNGTQINNQQCLFFDWYIVSIFFFGPALGIFCWLWKHWTFNLALVNHTPLLPAPSELHFLIGHDMLNCTMNLKNPIMQLLSREYFFCSCRTLQASQW